MNGLIPVQRFWRPPAFCRSDRQRSPRHPARRPPRGQRDPISIHSLRFPKLLWVGARSAGAASMSMRAHAIIASPHIRGHTAYHFAACMNDRAGRMGLNLYAADWHDQICDGCGQSHIPPAQRHPEARRNRLNSSYCAFAVMRGGWRIAPSGTRPSSTKRQRAIASLRASATIMIFRTRLLCPAVRSRNQRVSPLFG